MLLLFILKFGRIVWLDWPIMSVFGYLKKIMLDPKSLRPVFERAETKVTDSKGTYQQNN